jgi:hypothetical protein
MPAAGGSPDGPSGDCRFDFILVTPYQMPVHIENAFGAEFDT